MKKILVVTDGPARFAAFEDAMRGAGWEVCEKRSVEEALSCAGEERPGLAVIDTAVGGVPSYEIARRIIERSVFTNLVLVSDLDEKEFHEQSEGLGVLTAIPENPGKDHALKVMGMVEQIMG